MKIYIYRLITILSFSLLIGPNSYSSIALPQTGGQTIILENHYPNRIIISGTIEPISKKLSTLPPEMAQKIAIEEQIAENKRAEEVARFKKTIRNKNIQQTPNSFYIKKDDLLINDISLYPERLKNAILLIIQELVRIGVINKNLGMRALAFREYARQIKLYLDKLLINIFKENNIYKNFKGYEEAKISFQKVSQKVSNKISNLHEFLLDLFKNPMDKEKTYNFYYEIDLNRNPIKASLSINEIHFAKHINDIMDYLNFKFHNKNGRKINHIIDLYIFYGQFYRLGNFSKTFLEHINGQLYELEKRPSEDLTSLEEEKIKEFETFIKINQGKETKNKNYEILQKKIIIDSTDVLINSIIDHRSLDANLDANLDKLINSNFFILYAENDPEMHFKKSRIL